MVKILRTRAGRPDAHVLCSRTDV